MPGIDAVSYTHLDVYKRQVVSCLDSKQLFQAIAAALRGTFGLDYASLLIYDAEAKVLRLQVLDFPDGVGVIREDTAIPLDGTPAGHVFRTREARTFTPDELRASWPAASDVFMREGLRSICCAPLILSLIHI